MVRSDPFSVVRVARKESNGLLLKTPRSALSPCLSLQGLPVEEEEELGLTYSFRRRPPSTEVPMSVPRGVFVFSTFRFIFHALQGRRGGRTSRKTDAVTPVKEREAKRIAASSQPDAVQRRSLSFQSNTRKRASLEAARLYKEEHGLNDRHVRVVERVEVTFVPRRTVIREAPVLRSVAHILSDEHQNWVRSYVREHAVTRDGRLFIPDFIRALQENCNVELSANK